MDPRSRKPQKETEYGKGYSSDLDEGRIEYGPKPHHSYEDVTDQNPDDFNRYGGYYDTDDPRPYGGRYSYADQGSESEGYGREASGRSGHGQDLSGRGPKGYQRSDERIFEDVCDRIGWHSRIDASDIEVKVEAGFVTLSGSVYDSEMKRRVEGEAARIRGVKGIRNDLNVNKGA